MANIENIRKWVEALRSGEYEQGREALRTSDNRFCCLGVACDISGVGEWVEEHASLSQSPAYWCEGDDLYPDCSDITPPKGVQEWLGIHDVEPFVHVGNSQFPLTVLNDANKTTTWGFPKGRTLPFTFAQIADLIEKEWLM